MHTKRYMVKRINEAEKDRKNTWRKRRVVGRIYEIKYSFKGQKTDTRTE